MDFHPPGSSIHVIARGLIRRGENIVLCKKPHNPWYFLPGGHVENGEYSRIALAREIEEELDLETYTVREPIGISENIFDRDGSSKQHEINIVFEVHVPWNAEITSAEPHITFREIPSAGLSNTWILPSHLHDGIEQWLATGHPFFNTPEWSE